MAELNRKSVLFITQESTAGTPVDPSAGTEAVALQDGFTLTPSFEVLENAELKSSIGLSKQVLGIEQPSVSFDHYLRHSGVEATAPGFDLLIYSALGAKRTRSTERDTVAGSTAGTASTAATIVVDTGEGSEFARGDMLLIKDGTNGYSIRPVDSVSTDTLTLGFNLSNAPASGVNLGRDVTYGPGTAAPTFSAWLYRADGGAIELVAGNRVESMDITIEAGQFINASYTSQGTSYRFNPITIDATNDSLDFDDAGGEENASITQKTYKQPHELASAIQTAMDALTTDNITVTYSDTTGKFTIASDGATLSLLWNTGTNTATTIGGALGFTTTADDTGATSYASDNAITLAKPFTPSFDSADPLVAKDQELFIGGFDDITCVKARSVSVSVSNTIQDVESICAESGVAEKAQTERAISIDVTLSLPQYESDRFKRFNEGDDTKFLYVFGTKTGGDWDAGKSGAIYSPTCTITSFELASQDDTVVMNLTLTPFVNDNGDGEFYIGFV